MAEYWINADTGSDITGDGSESNPWETLAHAYNNSSAGDTIHVESATATYVMATDTMGDRAIVGEDAETCIFDGGGGSVEWTIEGDITFQNLTFRNLVQGAQKPFIKAYIVSGDGPVTTINNCVFHNMEWGGAYQYTSGLLYMMTHYPSGATLGLIINTSAFYDMRKVSGRTFAALILGGKWSGLSINLTNVSVALTTTTAATTLTSLFTSWQTGTTAVATFKNCIFYNGTGLTVKQHESGCGMWSYTITYSCGYLITGFSAGTGCITSDPLFFDAANGDLRLRPSSPCIDAGILI